MMPASLATRIEIVRGDITRQQVDAIVNAANPSLLGGGGVDGAIHRAAGPQLLAECRTLGGARTGEAKLTKGYALPARYVIHTVGPVWHGGNNDERERLADCYRNSLALASTHGIHSVAFPSISTGAYDMPIHIAAPIALAEATRFLAQHPEIDQVVFVLHSQADFDLYQRLWQEMQRP